MGAVSSEQIVAVLKSEIENYEVEKRDKEVGTVIYVGDGIATIYGIDHAMYGEKGMVQDIKKDSIGCILFDNLFYLSWLPFPFKSPSDVAISVYSLLLLYH